MPSLYATSLTRNTSTRGLDGSNKAFETPVFLINHLYIRWHRVQRRGKYGSFREELAVGYLSCIHVYIGKNVIDQFGNNGSLIGLLLSLNKAICRSHEVPFRSKLYPSFKRNTDTGTFSMLLNKLDIIKCLFVQIVDERVCFFKG